VKTWDDILTRYYIDEVRIYWLKGGEYCLVEVLGSRILRKRVKAARVNYIRMKLLEHGFIPADSGDDEEVWIPITDLDPLA